MKNALRINAVAKVVNENIEYFEHNGREHIRIPSFTLPDNVIMNGGLYPADEIAKSFHTLKGTLAPVAHPTVNGVAVVATKPEAINAHYVGVWNAKVERCEKSKRIYIEKWVDVEFAKKFEDGQRLLDAINNGDILHTSTGLHCVREPAPVGSAGYTWVARNMRFDHDAILFDEPGAATPEQGVGLCVNSADQAVTAVLPVLTTNAALPNSYGQKRDALSAAIREVHGSKEVYPHIEDFNDAAVIFYANGYKMVSYEFDGAAVVLGDTVTEMQVRTDFVAKGPTVVTSLALTGNSVECEPVKPIDEAEKTDAMTPEEIQKAIADGIKAALEPVTNKLAESESALTSMRESLETNAKAADAENRAAIIAAKPEMELVANSLSGKPLEALAAQLVQAAPLAAGGLKTNSKDSPAAAFKAYEGV